MDSVKTAVISLLALFVAFLAGCGDMGDDLFPEASDKRPPAASGTTGSDVGQNAQDFSLPDTSGGTVSLSMELATADAVVIYFTMWCPLCDSHMSHMVDNVIPAFPNVTFLAVDYVSASVGDASSAEAAHGFKGVGFKVLADTHQTVSNLYGGTMGTTVVVSAAGIVLMNEDYKDGTKLQSILGGLP